jgi:hypothetical protein
MPSPDPWEARETPAFALLADSVPDGKAEDGFNTDPLLCSESAPSCCFPDVGVEAAAVVVSDG